MEDEVIENSYGDLKNKDVSYIIKIALNHPNKLKEFHERVKVTYSNYNFEKDLRHLVKYYELGQNLAFRGLNECENIANYDYDGLYQVFEIFLRESEELTKNLKYYLRAFYTFLAFLVPKKLGVVSFDYKIKKYKIIFNGQTQIFNLVTKRKEE